MTMQLDSTQTQPNPQQTDGTHDSQVHDSRVSAAWRKLRAVIGEMNDAAERLVDPRVRD